MGYKPGTFDSAIDSIVKNIELMTALEKNKADIKKSLLIDQIQSKRAFEQKQAMAEQEHKYRMEEATADQDWTKRNYPNEFTSETQPGYQGMIANSQTPENIASQPHTSIPSPNPMISESPTPKGYSGTVTVPGVGQGPFMPNDMPNQIQEKQVQPTVQQQQDYSQTDIPELGMSLPKPTIRFSDIGKPIPISMLDSLYNKVYQGYTRTGTITKKELNNIVLPYLKSRGVDLNENKVNQQKLLNGTRLRQEFINRPEVKDYIVTSTNVKAMDSLLKNALAGNMQNKVALDQGLITMYNKLTDPQSVVRESEYARTPQNLPVINMISGAISKVQQGGAGITDKDRQALVTGAKIILNERGKQYNNSLQTYEELAVEYDIPIKLITEGKEPFNQYDIESQNNSGNKQYIVGEEIEAPNGRKYIVTGGDPSDPDIEEVVDETK